jgi:Protein of unknown function (DUF2854)
MIRKIPLALVCLVIGGGLTAVGFYAYATDQYTLNLAGFFYGIPVLLGGCALKAAELKPVPAKPTTPEVLALRTAQATPTQTQIYKDITRYRYGQEAHLDLALAALGLSPTDDERPIVTAVWEEAIEGAYAMVVEFSSPLIPMEVWKEKEAKMTRFFGPDVKARVAPSADKENYIELSLITSPGESADVVFGTPDLSKRTLFM